jgi:hypothetical protein
MAQNIFAALIFVSSNGYSKVSSLGVLKRGSPISDVTSNF